MRNMLLSAETLSRTSRPRSGPPDVFTKPRQYRLILRHARRDECIMETECQENNQGLEHIVPDK